MAAHRDLLETFQDQLDRALEAGDTDRAEALRERLEALRNGETSYLRSQRPGAMGLGTSDEVPRRPAGWKPPKKPDPMTTGASRRRR
ncbi:MAG: excinuclease subunit [Caulobacter sp.]|nr:excinuclease subunit [Caulobacter sp.]